MNGAAIIGRSCHREKGRPGGRPRTGRSALYPFQRLPSEVYSVDSSTGRREGQGPPASWNAFVGLAPRRSGRDHIPWGVAPASASTGL